MIKPYQELAINNYKLSNGRLEDTRKAVIKEHSARAVRQWRAVDDLICSPIQLKEQVGFLQRRHHFGFKDIDSIQLAEDLKCIDFRLNKSVENHTVSSHLHRHSASPD